MTMLSKIYEPFSIVVVPFPFTDMALHKRRPAMVISSVSHQKKTDHVSLLMITSAKHSHWYDDHALIDLNVAGLSVPSIVRQKIFTLDNRLIIRKIGELSAKDVCQVKLYLTSHIGAALGCEAC